MNNALMFAQQYQAMDNPVPDADLGPWWEDLRKGLAYAKLSGRPDKMKFAGPGPVLSLIREVQILRSFMRAVRDLPGLEEHTKKLAKLYEHFADHKPEMEQAEEPESKIIIPS